MVSNLKKRIVVIMMIVIIIIIKVIFKIHFLQFLFNLLKN